MPEIKSWDAVFFIKTLSHPIGVRVYYEVDRHGIIAYNGQTKEFGIEQITYNDNPGKGDTTIHTYGFHVVAGKPYNTEQDGRKLACMDIKVELVQKTEIKNSQMSSVISEFLSNVSPQCTTIRLECD